MFTRCVSDVTVDFKRMRTMRVSSETCFSCDLSKKHDLAVTFHSRPTLRLASLVRFLKVWNSIGTIRCYNDETENAIDVEFHDAQTHHPLHISNNDNFSMADMSANAVVLAAEGADDIPRLVLFV